MENSDKIMEIWNEVMKENKDVFTTDADRIFLAMKIAVHCHDLAWREGLLAVEEYIDGRRGMNQDEVPIWEFLKPTSWIASLMVEEDFGIAMLISLFSAYNYTGYQAVQGCVYLLSAAFMISESVRTDRLLAFFRSLVPEEAQEAFDTYFQQLIP